jgi:nitrite reductase (NADH) small subunit
MPKTYKVGALNEIPKGEGRNFEIGGRRIAVFRSREGQVFATQAECPHRRGPLADGLLGSGHLVCPLHEWRFDLHSGATENGMCSIAVFTTAVGYDGTVSVELPDLNDILPGSS